MYSIARSFVRIDHGWRQEDISSRTLFYALNNLQACRIVVTWGTSPIEFEIHLHELKDLLSVINNELTVLEWLATYTKDTIPSFDKLTDFNLSQCVKLTDLHTYPVFIGRGSHQHPSRDMLPLGTDSDLMITNDLPEYDEKSVVSLGKNSLLVCNGKILETVLVDGKLFGLNAQKEKERTGTSILSILDFTDIGGFSKLRMTDTNIHIATRTETEIDRHETTVVIDTGRSLTNLTPMVILDGVLKLKGTTVTTISDTKIKITVSHTDALLNSARRREGRVEWCGAVNSNLNGYAINTFDVKKFLQSLHSFIILINSNELNYFQETVPSTGILGCYRHYRMPSGIMLDDNGFILQYKAAGFTERLVGLNVGDTNRRRHLVSEFSNLKGKEAVILSTVIISKPVFMDGRIIEIYTV